MAQNKEELEIKELAKELSFTTPDVVQQIIQENDNVRYPVIEKHAIETYEGQLSRKDIRRNMKKFDYDILKPTINGDKAANLLYDEYLESEQTMEDYAKSEETAIDIIEANLVNYNIRFYTDAKDLDTHLTTEMVAQAIDRYAPQEISKIVKFMPELYDELLLEAAVEEYGHELDKSFIENALDKLEFKELEPKIEVDKAAQLIFDDIQKKFDLGFPLEESVTTHKYLVEIMENDLVEFNIQFLTDVNDLNGVNTTIEDFIDSINEILPDLLAKVYKMNSMYHVDEIVEAAHEEYGDDLQISDEQILPTVKFKVKPPKLPVEAIAEKYFEEALAYNGTFDDYVHNELQSKVPENYNIEYQFKFLTDPEDLKE